MSKIRLITSSDEHLADQNPGFRKDDYRGAILSKLAYQGDMAKRFEADALIRGGDFFHNKAANRTTHNTIQQAARIHRSYGFPTYALAGNHDMSNNDPESIYAQQPLGVLFSTGVFNELDDVVIEKGSLRVRIVGVPYTVDLNVDQLQQKVSKKKDDEYVIAVVHALAAMAPDARTSEFFNETIFDYRDLVFPGSPDAYVFGHYHKDQGIVDHMGVKFVNLGSISRGALTFENLERKPKIGMFSIDSSGLSVEEHVLPCADPSDIFDLEKKNKIVQEKKDIQEFIDRLRDDSTSKSTSDIRTTLASFPDDVKIKAMEILEAAEAGVMDE
jgi:DNA repair exonuclease SbcCD nuclease subunit